MAIKFSNNASGTLAASITSTATSITLTTGNGALFPALSAGDYFYATLVNSSNQIEIVKVTARASDVLTVTRAQEATTASAYSASDKLELRATAAAMSDVASGLNITNLPASTTLNSVAIVDVSSAQTLTNKTLTSPTITTPTVTSPTITGTPTVPTAVAGTNTTQAASTAFVVTAVANSIPSGTKMLFAQTAAPTGWTKDTTHDNKSLRVVSGTAGSGGTVDFTTAFASKTVSGTVGNTTLTEAQIPSHVHGGVLIANGGNLSVGTAKGATRLFGNSNATGGSGAHNHAFTGTAIDLAVQYVDVIIATKD